MSFGFMENGNPCMTPYLGMVEFREGLTDLNALNTKKQTLIIIDDLMTETDKSVSNLFTKGSHHRNLSVLHLVQNVFDKNKHTRTIILNAHYLVIFKNPRDASQITHLAKQMYPGHVLIFTRSLFRCYFRSLWLLAY